MELLTVNVSRSGALLLWEVNGEHAPRMHESCRLEILLPATRRFGQRSLQCDAEVVRVTANCEKSVIVGLRFTRMWTKNETSAPVATEGSGLVM